MLIKIGHQIYQSIEITLCLSLYNQPQWQQQQLQQNRPDNNMWMVESDTLFRISKWGLKKKVLP